MAYSKLFRTSIQQPVRMIFAVYRTIKLKDLATISSCASHIDRTQHIVNTPRKLNFDPDRLHLNRQLIGFAGKIPSPAQVLTEWKKRTEGVKKRSDSVLMQELVLSASPAYFIEGGEMATEPWVLASVQWLHDVFGVNVVSATLHLDELTPHIHAMVVPIASDKKGVLRLSADTIFNPLQLKTQQTSYAKSVAKLGISRGREGSSAMHTLVAEHYAKIHSAELYAKRRKAGLEQFRIQLPEPYQYESIHEYKVRAAWDADNQVSAFSHIYEVLEPAQMEAEWEANRAIAERDRAEATANLLRAENGLLKAKVQELTRLIQDIPLHEVMARLGYGQGEADGESRVYRVEGTVLKVAGNGFFDRETKKEGTGSISLVMHLLAFDDEDDAIELIAEEWSPEVAAVAKHKRLPTAVERMPLRKLKDRYCKRSAAADRRIVEYLTERGIPLSLIKAEMQRYSLYGGVEAGSGRVWCVFDHRLGQGATLVAADDKPVGKRFIGNKKTSFYMLRHSEGKVYALVECPVEALSLAALRPDLCPVIMDVVSISPSILATFPSGTVCAVAADSAGDTAAAALNFPRLRPEKGFTHWHQVLVARSKAEAEQKAAEESARVAHEKKAAVERAKLAAKKREETIELCVGSPATSLRIWYQNRAAAALHRPVRRLSFEEVRVMEVQSIIPCDPEPTSQTIPLDSIKCEPVPDPDDESESYRF